MLRHHSHALCVTQLQRPVILIQWRSIGSIGFFFVFFCLLCVHQFYWECWHFSVYISVRGKSSVLQMAAFRATMWLFSGIWGRSLNFAPSVGPDYTPPLNSSEGEVYWCIWLWCKGQLHMRDVQVNGEHEEEREWTEQKYSRNITERRPSLFWK